MKGSIYVSREVGLSAFRKSLQRRRKNNPSMKSATCPEELSDREMHIFQLLGSGLGTKQMEEFFFGKDAALPPGYIPERH